MKGSEFIVDFLVTKGVDTAFVFTGGAIAHVIDSIGKRNDKINYYCVQHEQVGAIAAEALSRTTGKMAVAVATSGPGATNLITGIVGAHYDCIPVLYLTGQVRTWELTGKDRLLQRGFQEVDIVSMVKKVTKYSATVEKIEELEYHLEKAFHLAMSGRPGPVLLDLPMDIQFSEVDLSALKKYSANDDKVGNITQAGWENELTDYLDKSIRPVIIAGGGIRHAGVVAELKSFIDSTKIPVVLSYASKDLLPTDHPCNCGVMGQFGQSSANAVVQSADLVLGLGTRFNIRQAGSNMEQFAPGAKKVLVNIDDGELQDGRLKGDLLLNIDLAEFFQNLSAIDVNSSAEWIDKYNKLKNSDNEFKSDNSSLSTVNPYEFYAVLSEKVDAGSIIIPDAGQNVIVPSQSFKIKDGQRFVSSWGNSPMGFSFPASIGAQIGSPDKQVVAIIGDGGMQVNIQDLQTVKNYNTPVKVFIINNQVYGAILEFQDAELDKRYEATDLLHGYSHPDFESISKAYRIPYFRINNSNDFGIIDKCLNTKGPAICEVMVDCDFRIISPAQKPDKPIGE